MKSCASAFFYLDPGSRDLIFYVDGSGRRSELRHLREWTVDSTAKAHFAGTLRLEKPSRYLPDEYTFAQVHDANPRINKPVVRLVWKRKRNEFSDHLFAVVRSSPAKRMLRGFP